MTYNEIMSELKKGKYRPLYFLYGEEPYYIDKVSDYIEQHALDDMAREFDQTIVYGKDYERDMGPIISAARRFPMMGRQVIIVKEAQNIKKWDPLELYLKQPMETTILVFCYKYGKPDKRLRVFKELEAQGGVMMESAVLRDYQVQKWVIDYVNEWSAERNLNVSIDLKAALLLVDSLGTDLTKIVGELDKLVIGMPAGTKVITPELIERNIGISKDFNVFELQNALRDGDVLKANRIVRYFSQSKQHPIQKELISVFNWFQNLLLYHYLPDKSEPAVASALGINRYFVKDYAAAARRYTAGKAFRVIGYIRETDARSKGINNSSADDLALWQELIYKILH